MRLSGGTVSKRPPTAESGQGEDRSRGTSAGAHEDLGPPDKGVLKGPNHRPQLSESEAKVPGLLRVAGGIDRVRGRTERCCQDDAVPGQQRDRGGMRWAACVQACLRETHRLNASAKLLCRLQVSPGRRRPRAEVAGAAGDGGVPVREGVRSLRGHSVRPGYPRRPIGCPGAAAPTGCSWALRLAAATALLSRLPRTGPAVIRQETERLGCPGGAVQPVCLRQIKKIRQAWMCSFM